MLRYRDGKPLTYRRYDHLWQRIGEYLPWVAVQQISTHWLRHTTLTWVERNFGYAVAPADLLTSPPTGAVPGRGRRPVGVGLGKRSVLGTSRMPRATTSLPSEPPS